MQLLSKAVKETVWQTPVVRGYLSDTSPLPEMEGPIHTAGCRWTEAILPYQLCSAISTQRHKRYLIHASSNVLDSYTITIEFSKLMSKIDTSKGGPVKEAGGRLGKLDAATESGMFHKVNKSKLEQLKKTLKDKPIEKKSEPTADPAGKSED